MKLKSTFKKVGTFSCSILLVAAIVGCSTAYAKPRTTEMTQSTLFERTETVSTGFSSRTSASVTESYIGETEAKSIALAHARVNSADALRITCKLDYDDGVAEYDVEFWDGSKEYDYEINALTGNIMSYDYDMESYDSKPVTTPTTTPSTTEYIGETKAKSIALAHAGVNSADALRMICKLDYDDGVAEYDVEFWDGSKEYDYEINALTGNIMSYDYDMESYDSKPVTTPTTTPSTTEYIGETKAKSIALAHAGVTESNAGRIKCEFDFDDGYAEYEVEWEIGRTEYEYTISATDGAIWEHDVEYDD